MNDFITTLTALHEKNEPYSIVTVVHARGSLPQNIGAKCLITQNGIHFGTIGGGKLEAWAINKSQELFQENTKNLFAKLNLQKDIGMSCGGEATLYFEVHNTNTWNIAIFGAGHISQALVKILITLNCNIYCIDTRAEWLEKFPNNSKLKTIQVDNYEDGTEKIPENSYLLSITRGSKHDLAILRKAILKKFPYIGGIGSITKSNSVKKKLQELDYTKEQVEKYICPVGLKLGNNTPPEIAVSIAAQLLSIHGSQNT